MYGSMLWKAISVCVLILGWTIPGSSQTETPAPPTQASAPQSADASISNGKPLVPQTPAELKGEAWDLLTNSQNPAKNSEIRIQGLAALGTMGSNPRSVKLISTAFADKDVDVRTAAVLAAGLTRDRTLLPEMRKMLDDKEPQVVFTAASTLWKMHDQSGEDILMAVVDGERKAGPGLVHGSLHSMNREMHDPVALAKLGAEQGLPMLFGPAGYGLAAYDYIRKNGGSSPRATAIEEVSQDHTAAVRREMLSALTDKDQAVRTAAAKALRSYHDAEVAKALAKLFDDTKHPVQFSAAAAYLISTRAVAMPPPPPLEKP